MELVLPNIKGPRTLEITPDPLMDDDRYFDFCQMNPTLRIERTAEGKIVIMPPVGLESNDQEFQVGMQLGMWAEKDGRGRAFGPTAEFILPNRAGRAPDASWISYSQLAKLTIDERAKFPHLCPEFVIEVQSPSDRLKPLRAKMQEWIDNGAQLGWLINGRTRTVTIYRPGREPEELADPAVVVGEGPVKGFRLNMTKVWAGW
jgi:Uma2 family endonuclease